MILFTTYLWGDKYPEEHVRRLFAGVKRNISACRFALITDAPRGNLQGLEQVEMPSCDLDLTEEKGCFARLRLFDPDFQRRLSLNPGGKVVNLDLDMVITGRLDWLEDRTEPFSILQNINTTNPCPYNGSVWMLQAGYRPDVWSDFSIKNYHDLGVPYHAFPDDQGWFEHKLPNAGAFGPDCGVYGFKKRGWAPKAANDADTLPANACIIAFPGWRDPSKFEHLPWVKDNWRI
jgi:hypothetical protein